MGNVPDENDVEYCINCGAICHCETTDNNGSHCDNCEHDQPE